MEKRHVVAFDFDGTMTTGDTFVRFACFARGRWHVLASIIRCAPYLLAYALGCYPNGKAKERLFGYFFRGMDYSRFVQLGIDFSDRIDDMVRPDMLQRMAWHQSQGHTVYVVSASIAEWVAPWCRRQAVHGVLCTEAEVGADGLLTGRFRSSNCYGQEKVERLRAAEPDRACYVLHVYGDSAGDRPLMQWADEAVLVNRKSLETE